jgi:hypothetical protein
MDLLCSAGSVSIVASLVYLLDFLLVARLGAKGDIE